MTQYTLRNVPPEVDRALRRAAREADQSLNQAAIEILERALGVGEEPARRRDLSDVLGSWQEDPETAAVLDEQRRVDPDDWR